MKTFKAHIEEKLNEATAKVSDFIGHSHAKRAGIGVKVHMSSIGGRGDEVTLSHSDPAKLHKYADNHLGGEEQGVVVKHNGKTWSPKNESVGKTPGDKSYYYLQRAKKLAANDGHNYDKLPQYHRGAGQPHKDHYMNKAKNEIIRFWLVHPYFFS